MSACDTCNDTKTIRIAVGPPILVGESWGFARQTVPCPECTDAGRQWAEEEDKRIQSWYYDQLAAEAREES